MNEDVVNSERNANKSNFRLRDVIAAQLVLKQWTTYSQHMSTKDNEVRAGTLFHLLLPSELMGQISLV
jgi:hypothetical protein